MTFMSFTQQPSTSLSVSVARFMPVLMASPKPLSETALISVTEATVITRTFLSCSLLLVAPYPRLVGAQSCPMPADAAAGVMHHVGILFTFTESYAAGRLACGGF